MGILRGFSVPKPINYSTYSTFDESQSVKVSQTVSTTQTRKLTDYKAPFITVAPAASGTYTPRGKAIIKHIALMNSAAAGLVFCNVQCKVLPNEIFVEHIVSIRAGETFILPCYDMLIDSRNEIEIENQAGSVGSVFATILRIEF